MTRFGGLGCQPAGRNQFGESALELDVRAKETVLDTLRESQVPIRVVSEEHGTADIGANPRFLGLLDGLDGSNRYLAGPGPSGTAPCSPCTLASPLDSATTC